MGALCLARERAVRPSLHLNLKSISTVEIALDQDGGTGGLSVIEASSGEDMPTITTLPTKTGYIFGGYYTQKNGAGTQYITASGASAAQYPESGGPTTLYAKWTAITYSIKYNTNGGSGTMANSSHTYGVAKNLTANGFSKTGYSFAGWATSTTGAVKYSNSQSVSNLSTTNGAVVNLYAVWTINSYTISVTSQDSTKGDVIGGGVYNYGTSVTIFASPKVGYSILYWSVRDGSGAEVDKVYSNSVEVVVSTVNYGYVAVFGQAIDGINVAATYGGTALVVGDNYDSLADSDTITLVATVCVMGYEFSHWQNQDGEVLASGEDNKTFRITKAQAMDSIITAVFVEIG